MSNFTCNAIKSTFLELLEERPLSEITVKDIVERCGINRNSFYYHFQDLPSLIEEIVKEEADLVIQKHHSVSSIVECYDALVDFASNHKTAILHIYRSINRDVFERNLMGISCYFVRSYISTLSSEITLNECDKEIVINYYKCACFGLIIDWLEHDMKEEYAASIRKIFKLKKESAFEIADMLKDQV